MIRRLAYVPMAQGRPSETAIPLTLSRRTLASAGATDASGIGLHIVVQSMVLHGGDAADYDLFFIGKRDGVDLIVQPYETPQLAWWMGAYDLANIAFTGVNLIMMAHTVISLAKGVPALFNALRSGTAELIGTVKSDASKLADWISSKFEDAVGDNGDLVNVDTDVDIDVDTDIDVDESAVKGLAMKIGTALWQDKGAILKFVLKNAAIMGGMTGSQKLLEFWYKKAGQDYSGEMPSAFAPFGLLMNYMENSANDIAERWTTFSYLVAQGADAPTQTMIASGLLSLKNTQEDQALAQWRWSEADAAAALNAMLPFTAVQDQPKAWEALGNYRYKGQPLPLKVGAGVGLKYIVKVS